MKKTFLYLSMVAFFSVCAVSCGNDDGVEPPPPAPETLPLPAFSAQAATYTLADEVNDNINGAQLKSINFTESGKAVFEVLTKEGKTKYAAYTMEVSGGVYTVKDDSGKTIGTVETGTNVRTVSSTAIKINVTIYIAGAGTLTFTTGEAVNAQLESDNMQGGNVLNNIARTWTVRSLFLTLDGDVSLSKLVQSGNLEEFIDEAQKRGAGLSKDEENQLRKIVKSFTLDKNGNFIIEYTENDKSNYVEAGKWKWHGTGTKQLSLTFKDLDMGNKFLSNNSIIDVDFNAAGGCTFTLNTEIKGSKNYKANLIIVLK